MSSRRWGYGKAGTKFGGPRRRAELLPLHAWPLPRPLLGPTTVRTRRMRRAVNATPSAEDSDGTCCGQHWASERCGFWRPSMATSPPTRQLLARIPMEAPRFDPQPLSTLLGHAGLSLDSSHLGIHLRGELSEALQADLPVANDWSGVHRRPGQSGGSRPRRHGPHRAPPKGFERCGLLPGIGARLAVDLIVQSCARWLPQAAAVHKACPIPIVVLAPTPA